MNESILGAGHDRAAMKQRTRSGANWMVLEQPRVHDGSDQVLSLLAHELRTPLANVISWAALLKSRLSPAEVEVRRGLEVILTSARAQARLIDEVLDSRRLELGKILLQRKMLTLNSFIEQLVASHGPAAESARLRLTLDVGATRSARVWADPVRLMQIVGNLLSNAIKFTPPGGSVECVTRVEGAEVAITVRDDGCGIPAPSLARIFDSFYQVKSTGGSGLGLGLAVVKQLVQLHGGRVSVESDGLGKGAAFTVWLEASEEDR